MYGDIPLILQGAAQRETLSPEQLTRLQAQGIPTASSGGSGTPARVNMGGMLPFLAVGAVAAWFLSRGKRSRSLWTVLLLLLPSWLSAQIPAGLSGWYSMTEWCATHQFTATYTNFEPSKVLIGLQRAKKCNVGLLVVYPRRLYTENGENKGPYSPVKHRLATDAYAKALPPDTLRKYVASHTLLGIVTGDDFGCASCWGGAVIPLSEARDAANYAKKKMPNAPIGIRLDALKASHVTGWKTDFNIAQWVRSKYMLRVYGNQTKWYALNAVAATQIGTRQFYYFNTSDCYGATPHTQCPASIVKEQGTIALAQTKNCGFNGPWFYDAPTYTGAYKTAYVNLFSVAAGKPFTSCLVR